MRHGLAALWKTWRLEALHGNASRDHEEARTAVQVTASCLPSAIAPVASGPCKAQSCARGRTEAYQGELKLCERARKIAFGLSEVDDMTRVRKQSAQNFVEDSHLQLKAEWEGRHQVGSI